MGIKDRVRDKIRKTCPVCKGDGKIAVTPQTKVRGWERKPRKVVLRVKCVACNGKGYIF